MIWVTGAAGMLGRELCEALAAAGYDYAATDRELDILDPVAVLAYARERRPGWIVNCAAYTAVDRAEDEEALATRLNADGPAHLAAAARDIGARLLHISTDYVFAGDGTRPYLESDPVRPLGAYGRGKALGEAAALKAEPGAVILRTAWLYGRHGPNFVATMLRLMAERESLGVVADQRGSPTWARDLAAAIVAIVGRRGFPAGVYHYTNSGEASWYEFACAIQRLGLSLGLLTRPCLIKPLATSEYPTKAARPAYSVLSKDKIMAQGLRPPAWEDSLSLYLSALKRDKEL